MVKKIGEKAGCFSTFFHEKEEVTVAVAIPGGVCVVWAGPVRVLYVDVDAGAPLKTSVSGQGRPFLVVRTPPPPDNEEVDVEGEEEEEKNHHDGTSHNPHHHPVGVLLAVSAASTWKWTL